MSTDRNDTLLSALKARVDALYLNYIFPVLATVRVGKAAEAVRFEDELRAAAERSGVILRRYILPADTAQADIEALIRQMNADALLPALLLVQPLPPQMDAAALQALIAPEKAMEALACPALLQRAIDAAERNAT